MVTWTNNTFIMVLIRTILTLSIAILIANNLLVEAGIATKKRIDDLETRAKVHNEILKPYKQKLKEYYSELKENVDKQLSEISDIVIKLIIDHKSFKKYLKNVFTVLQKYAERQIESRFDKLKTIYEKWEKEKFPEKNTKAEALKILKKQEEEKKALRKQNTEIEKKSKAKVIDKKPKVKNDGQKKDK